MHDSNTSKFCLRRYPRDPRLNHARDQCTAPPPPLSLKPHLVVVAGAPVARIRAARPARLAVAVGPPAVAVGPPAVAAAAAVAVVAVRARLLGAAPVAVTRAVAVAVALRVAVAALAVASLAAVAAVAAFGAVVVRAPLRPLPSSRPPPPASSPPVAARAARAAGRQRTTRPPPPAPLLGAVVARRRRGRRRAWGIRSAAATVAPAVFSFLPLLPPLGTAPLALVPLALPLLGLLPERLHLRLVRLLLLPSLLLGDVPLLLPPLPLLHTARHRVRHQLGGRLALASASGREVGRSEVGSSAAPAASKEVRCSRSIAACIS